MTAKTRAPKPKPAAKRASAKAMAPAKAVSAAKAASPTISSPPVVPVVEAVVPVTRVPKKPVAAVETATAKTSATSATATPIATAFNPLNLAKDPIMATAFETTTDAVRNTVSNLNAQTEAAVNNSKAAMEQVASKSKEAVEASMKSLDELSDMTRANVDALIASARVATSGVEQVMTHLTEVSKKSFEDTSAMMKGLASAKTPNELMQMQSDFAKAQFDSAVAEYSKLSEMMVKLAGEVMEPMQNQAAIATDKMKAAFTAK
jgi:phasin family protein